MSCSMCVRCRGLLIRIRLPKQKVTNVRTFSTGVIRSSQGKNPLPKRRFVEQGGHKESGLGLGAVFLLTIPVTTFCLGVWQVKRRTWKLNLIEELNKKTQAPPVPLPDDLHELDNLEYQRVFVRGVFDHSKEIFIGPRSIIKGDGGAEQSGGGLITSGDSIGWHVITPFELNDGRGRILVNRGWIPKNRMKPLSRRDGQVTGEIDLVGVVRKTEQRPQFAPKNQENSNRWHFRDIPALAETLDTLPVFLDADLNSTIPGGPVGGQTRVTLRNEHLSYILTWFSLSAITSYMWIKKFILK